MNNENLKERYQATLLGGAIGDTLGMPVEGWKREQIKKYVGKITEPIDPVIIKDANGEEIKEDEFGNVKSYGKGLRKGSNTDDTISVLAVGESIATLGRIDIDDIGKRHLAAYLANMQPDGKALGAFGKTSMLGFERLRLGYPAQVSGVKGGPGNAPPMKMSPVGLYMDATNQYEFGLLEASKIAKITHLDPRSIVSGMYQAHAIYTLLQDVSRKEFIDSFRMATAKINLLSTLWDPTISEDYLSKDEFTWPNSGTVLKRLEWIIENSDVDPEAAFQVLGASSSVYRSYPFALFMFQKYWDDPMAGLVHLVNFGGDCDTTGAIYGGLAGANNGAFYPKEWLTFLEGRDRLITVADKLYTLKRTTR